MTENQASAVIIPLGAMAGAGVSATAGNIGLVGSFGGVSIWLAPMTAIGGMVGSATYGTMAAIADQDAAVFLPITVGVFSGAGVSAVLGGMGLSVGGTAVGIGLGAMAAAGGILGLGIYGLARVLAGLETKESPWEVTTRMEPKFQPWKRTMRRSPNSSQFWENLSGYRNFTLWKSKQNYGSFKQKLGYSEGIIKAIALNHSPIFVHEKRVQRENSIPILKPTSSNLPRCQQCSGNVSKP